MKYACAVLTFISSTIAHSAYCMESPTLSHPGIVADYRSSPFKQQVWQKIKATIENKEPIKLNMPELHASTINQPIIIGDKVLLVFYLLVTYALNTSEYSHVDHYLDYITCVLENGADINGFAGYETGLMYLARFASRQDPSSIYYKSDNRVMDVLNLLLQYKPDVNLRHGLHQSTALLMSISAVGNKLTLQVTKALLSAGANLSLANQDSNNPLKQAARAGNTSLIDLLIKHGASLDSIDFNEIPPTIDEKIKVYLKTSAKLREVNKQLAQISAYEQQKYKIKQLEDEIAHYDQHKSILDSSLPEQEIHRTLQRPSSKD